MLLGSGYLRGDRLAEQVSREERRLVADRHLAQQISAP
jgi:hypothetical protein